MYIQYVWRQVENIFRGCKWRFLEAEEGGGGEGGHNYFQGGGQICLPCPRLKNTMGGGGQDIKYLKY